MKTHPKRLNPRSSAPLLAAKGLTVLAPGGRPLFEDLELSMSHERIAVVGRNGAGKSTLLEVLAGHREPDRGTIHTRTPPLLVPQELRLGPEPETVRDWVVRHAGERALESFARASRAAALESIAEDARLDQLSRGELRKVALISARIARPELLLLDEPTQDLDQAGMAWLLGWLERSPSLLCVTHDRELLASFRCFFIVSESGCRSFEGSFDELELELERDRVASEERYVRNLRLLVDRERDNARFAARRQRKKNRGRVNELDRCPARALLNQKRSYAQVEQGRIAERRLARISALRDWAKSTRRALAVTLPLELTVPDFPGDEGGELLRFQGVRAVRGGRTLFDGLELVATRRARIGVVGPNGSGKTTLLQLILGVERPARGLARVAPVSIGSVSQGATDWADDESLWGRLASSAGSLEAIGELIAAHKFPLALAERPLGSLSPGERLRAALICLWRRTPPVDLLVLDEPTINLDLLGEKALATSLRAWPGALVIASHDAKFLRRIGVEVTIELDGRGGHILR